MADAPVDTESLAEDIKSLSLHTEDTETQPTVPEMGSNKRTRKGKPASQEHSTEETVTSHNTADGQTTVSRASPDKDKSNNKDPAATSLPNETTATTTLPSNRRKAKTTTNRYIPPHSRAKTTSDRTTTEQNKSNNLPYRLLQQPTASTRTPFAPYPQTDIAYAQPLLESAVAASQSQRAHQDTGLLEHDPEVLGLDAGTLEYKQEIALRRLTASIAAKASANHQTKLELSTQAPLSARDARALARNAYRASQEADSPRPSKSPILYLLPRPTPTPSYLHLSSLPPTRLPSPRPLLIILDLNGTLLHRTTRGGSTFAQRPHLQPFLTYLLHHHKVMIWSSARRENVAAMVSQLFPTPTLHAQLAAVWARDTLRLTPAQARQRVQVYKQLSWVWADAGIQATAPTAPPSHGPPQQPGVGGRWSQANTVLLDDSEEKAAAEPHNLLKIEAFEDRVEQRTTDVLGQVVRYLEALKWQGDVSASMRARPFVARGD